MPAQPPGQFCQRFIAFQAGSVLFAFEHGHDAAGTMVAPLVGTSAIDSGHRARANAPTGGPSAHTCSRHP